MTRKQICLKAGLANAEAHRLKFKEKFWARVIQPSKSECWTWTGTIGNGYGQVKRDGRMRLAHRVSYDLCIGPIPKGKYVCHKCDNKRCVNPNHLFIGTASDNTIDSVKKGRWGASKLTPDQIPEIRKLSNEMTRSGIAKKFNVKRDAIDKILQGRNWKCV